MKKKEKKIIACFHPETTKSLKENLYNLKNFDKIF